MSWWRVKTDIKSQAFQNAAYIYRVLGCQAMGEFAGGFLIRAPSDLAGQELSGKIFKDVLVDGAEFMDSTNYAGQLFDD